MRQLARVCRRRRRQLCRLHLQRVLLQVFLDDIQVHVGAGQGRRAAPGPSVQVQPDLSHVSHLTDTEQDGVFCQGDFLQQSGSTMALILEICGFFFPQATDFHNDLEQQSGLLWYMCLLCLWK